MYLLGKYGGYPAQDKLWQFLEGGTLVIHVHTNAERERMRALLMRQYSDTPMDVADASLGTAAGALEEGLIFTLDSDFHVYRLQDGGAFEVVP